MLVHQAVYGPSGGHAYLQGSDPSRDKLFRGVAWRTDLPQTAPAGVQWTPFFRLLKENEHFLFILTRAAEGEERSGTVISRAAFIPASELEAIQDLRPIALHLLEDWVIGDKVAPIEIANSVSTPTSSDAGDLARRIAGALGKAQKHPVVVLGQDGFEDAVFNLWERVPQEYRPHLTFGLSFGPDDVKELAVVCTPADLVQRWEPTQLVGPDDAESSYAATLLDLPVDASVRAFAKEVSLSLNSAAAIEIAVRAAELWTSQTNATEAIELLRVLTERAGNTPSAMKSRAAVLARLVKAESTWSAQNVMTMRNLELGGVAGEEAFNRALSNWTERATATTEARVLAGIVQSWLAASPKPGWVSAVEIGLQSSLKKSSVPDELVLSIWLAATKLPNQWKRCLDLLGQAPDAKKRLRSVLPQTIRRDVVDALAPGVSDYGWWDIAGVLFARSRSAAEALASALAMAPPSKKAQTALFSGALSEAAEPELVGVAVFCAEPAALQIAADACIQNPELLKSFNWTDPRWFLLLDAALATSPDISGQLPNPVAGMETVIASQLAVDSVWSTVAKCSLRDLTSVPSRARAWGVIAEPARAMILGATAVGWLQQFEAGDARLEDVEPELTAVITQVVRARGYLLGAMERSPAALLKYLEVFSFASEAGAIEFLSSVRHSGAHLGEDAARAVGRILNNNNWSSAAKEPLGFFSLRADLRPIYKECIRLLDPVQRMWVSYQLNMTYHLSSDEAWEAFETEALTLYPRGPSERELWIRSGGYIEDLAMEDTGRARWSRCVRELRAGKAPGVQALIGEMSNEYPHNDALRQLKRQYFGR